MTTEPVRDQLLATIQQVRVDATAANLLARGDDLASSSLHKVTFDADTTARVTADVLDFATALAAREFIEYDPSYQTHTGQALVDDLEQVPELERLHELVLAGVSPFDSPSNDDQPIVAMVHRAYLDRETGVTAYRLKGPGIATRRPKGILALLPRDGVLEAVPHEIVYYEPRFDVIVVGTKVLVTASSMLSRTLGSSERAKSLATRTFALATTRLTIEGSEALAEAVSTDPNIVAKMAQLARILESERDYAEALTMKNVLEFLDENPHVAVATAGSGSKRTLVFERGPQTRSAIVKLLADDFLESRLTKRMYEAGTRRGSTSRSRAARRSAR